MAKVLSGACNLGIVSVSGVVIPDAQILSDGHATTSTGIVIIDEDKSYYVASNASDIKTLLQNLDTILQQIILITTALDAVTTSPGTAAAGITALGLLKTQLALTQELIK